MESEISRPVARMGVVQGAFADHLDDLPVHDRDASREDAGRDSRRTPSRAWWLLVLAVVAGLVAWVALRDPAAQLPGDTAIAAPLELAAVDVVAVQPRVLSSSLPLSGSIAPVVQATVKSKVSGQVQQVTVREGQDVRQGEVIARIETSNLQAEYDRAVASMDKARAEMELATLNRDKNRQLLEQHYISQNAYESTESAYAASVATYKLEQAQVRLMKINLDDAVIRAPFDGTVARRLVQPGEKVSADSSIMTLVDLRQMLLEAGVPAADIPSVRVGQEVRFKVAGFGDREFSGQVQRINPMTTEGSRAITIYVAVPNQDGALKGGMFAQGTLTLAATQPVLSVPQRAIRMEAGAPYVYTLADSRLSRRNVILGPQPQDAAFVEVRSGLSAGERVVVADIGEGKAGASAFVRGEAAPDAAAPASDSTSAGAPSAR